MLSGAKANHSKCPTEHYESTESKQTTDGIKREESKAQGELKEISGVSRDTDGKSNLKDEETPVELGEGD